MPKETVQDLMIKDLLEFDEPTNQNETLELLEFMRNNAVPITEQQAMACYQLKEFGLHDVANYIMNVRTRMVNASFFYKLIDKLTLADRIKGNAKLKDILKANANPANANMSQYQPQGMSKREIGG